MNNRSLIFIFPPEAAKKDFLHHLGVGYIQAFLKKREIDSIQYVPEERLSVESLVEEVLDFGPIFIGFTVFDFNYYLVKIISKKLKQRNKSIQILAGGPTATFSDSLIMEDNPSIDICVRGEGEYTVYELLNHFVENGDLNDIGYIQGITYRKNGKIERTPDRPLIRDFSNKDGELDVIPSPYLEGVFRGDEKTGILTSRGCTFKCTYCNFTIMSKNRIRYHSIDRVISELRIINDTMVKENLLNESVNIYDDAFSLNINRAKEICKRIAKENFKIKFSCETRVDRMDEELLELMKKAGIKDLSFGLESAVPEILRNIKKVGDFRTDDFKKEKEFIEKIKYYVNFAKNIGLNPVVSIISGLPGETLKDGKKTVQFVKELNLDFYAHNFLQIFPGTELFYTHKNYGIGIEKSPSLLPFETIFSYDVSKVPFGKNSTIQNEKDKAISFIISGLVNSQERAFSKSSVLTDVVLKNINELNNNLIEWLSKNSSLLSNMIFLYDRKEFEREDTIKKMIYGEVPTKKFYFLKLIINKLKKELSEAKIYHFVTSKAYRWDLYFSFVPFRYFANNKNKKLYEISKVIYEIKNEDDLKYFEEFIPLMFDEEKKELKKELMDFKGCFLNGCRWSNRECPSLNLQKIIIEEDGSIKPCITGKKIGSVGENLDEIEKRFLELFEKEKKIRGCNYCEIKEFCSKCVFPLSIDVKKYCEIRRKYLFISKIVNFMEIASRMPGLIKE
ncbi:MAG: radical SAM protein [Acidobacteriota bacterium]